MGKFASIIKSLRMSQGLTQGEFAGNLGISKSALNMYERGEREPSFETVEHIADRLNLELDTLLGRKPSRETVENWDARFNTDGKLADEVETLEQALSRIRLYHIAASGQWLSEGHNFAYAYSEDMPNNADFVLRVRGDSMEPIYSDGDIVFVKSNVIVESGQIGMFCLNDRGYLKLLQGNKLVSVNAAYKPVVVKEWDTFFCAGRVTGKKERT